MPGDCCADEEGDKGRPEKQALLPKLGKHKTGKGCLYINTLEDVDLDVLSEMFTTALSKQQRFAARKLLED